MPPLPAGLLLLVAPGFILGLFAALLALWKRRSWLIWFVIAFLDHVAALVIINFLDAFTDFPDIRFVLYVLWAGPFLVLFQRPRLPGPGRVRRR